MYQQDGQSIEVVDAQVHLWRNEGPDNPWPPAWNGAHRGGISPSAEELIAEMDAASVDRAVLVAPFFGGEANNGVVADAARGYPHRFIGLGLLLDVSQPQPEAVASWSSTTGLAGIRLSQLSGPTTTWLADGTAEWLWPVAAAAGLPVMIFCPGQLEALVGVLERHPDLRLTLDHAGIPSRALGVPIEEIVEAACALAPFPGAAVKASALVNHVEEPYPFPTAQRCVRRLVDAFGADRVFWGTDLTRGMPCSYTEATTYLAEEGGLDSTELELVMGAGIRRWLNWS